MNACILSREDLGWLLFRYITIRVGLYPSALLSDSCLPSPVFHACETRQQSGDHRRNNYNDILRSIIMIICLAKRMLVCQFSIYKIIWLWWSNYNRFFFLPFTKEVFKITRKSTHRCLSLYLHHFRRLSFLVFEREPFEWACGYKSNLCNNNGHKRFEPEILLEG